MKGKLSINKEYKNIENTDSIFIITKVRSDFESGEKIIEE